jgi:chemotaxis protein methyltransferase CheR
LKDQTAQGLRPHDFKLIRDVIYQKIGLELDGKEVLVAARIGKTMRAIGIPSFEQYYAHVQRDPTGEAMTTMVDALVTNHTSFFREPQHFDYMRKVILPGLEAKAPVRIWSAACSSGEEPYSIAFALIEELGFPTVLKARILATDISERILATAKRGLYPKSRVQSVPLEQLRLHMLKGYGASDGEYMMKKEVRALVEFQKLNLMEDFSKVGMFSIIFCRNVMIYFDQITQQRLVNRLAAQLQPGGYLLIGHAESLNGMEHPLTYVCPATYCKPASGHALRQRGQ